MNKTDAEIRLLASHPDISDYNAHWFLLGWRACEADGVQNITQIPPYG